MGLRFDRTASIRRKRVTFRKNTESVLNLLYETFIYSLLPVFITGLLVFKGALLPGLAVVLLVVFLMLYVASWHLLNSAGRQQLVALLKARFPKLPIIDNGLHSVMAQSGSGFFFEGKWLVVTFDERLAYVNLLSPWRFRTRSIAGPIPNYFRIRKALREFKSTRDDLNYSRS